MINKLLNDPDSKDKVIKAIIALTIIGVIILSFDIFTETGDGRKQIVDEDGGVEAELCYILSDIDGVGDVDVMLQYDDDNVTGAIVTAQGASDPIIKNKLVNAVMALFNINAGCVEVFEKKAVDIKEESLDEK